MELIPGSFFDSVPAGADIHILKTVLHNWPDDAALKILRNCRAAMKPGQRLLMPDFLVIRDDFNTIVPFMDMAGMLIYSGRERSAEILAGMLKETGFEFGRSFPLPGRQVVYEAIAV